MNAFMSENGAKDAAPAASEPEARGGLPEGAERSDEALAERVRCVWAKTVGPQNPVETRRSSVIAVAKGRETGFIPPPQKTDDDTAAAFPPPDDAPTVSIAHGSEGSGGEVPGGETGSEEADFKNNFASPDAAGDEEEKLVGIDSFRLDEELGRGGMGLVRLAYQESLLREVAVKTLKENTLPRSKEAAAFFREAFVTGALTHPNIIPVHLYGRDSGGRPFLVMKRVRGRPWSELMHGGWGGRVFTAGSSRRRKSGGFSPTGRFTELAHNLDIFQKICDAISFAHAHGVVHLDLKPSNVMVGDHGEVTVMDWGLARYVQTVKGNAGGRQHGVVLAGTPAYMAPEMALGEVERIGPGTDIYLLGGILFEIVTGRPPHTGRTPLEVVTRAAKGEVESFKPRAGLPREGRALERIVRRALAKDSEKRYPTVEALQEDVRAFLAGQGDRHESEMLVREGRRELTALQRETEMLRVVSPYYPRCTELLAKIGRATALWSLNPRAVRLRRDALAFYAELSLRGRDWGLCESLLRDLRLSGAEGAASAEPLEEKLRAERSKWERREYLLDRAARAGALAALLFAVVIVILIIMLQNLQRQLDRLGRGEGSGRRVAASSPADFPDEATDSAVKTAAAFRLSVLQQERAPSAFASPLSPPSERPPFVRQVGFLPSADGKTAAVWDLAGRVWAVTQAKGSEETETILLRGPRPEGLPAATAWLTSSRLLLLDRRGHALLLDAKAPPDKRETPLAAPPLKKGERFVSIVPSLNGPAAYLVTNKRLLRLRVESEKKKRLSMVAARTLPSWLSPLGATSGGSGAGVLIVGTGGALFLRDTEVAGAPVRLRRPVRAAVAAARRKRVAFLSEFPRAGLRIYDFGTGSGHDLQLPLRGTKTLALSPTGRYVALGNETGRVLVIALSRNNRLAAHVGKALCRRPLAALAFTDETTLFALETGAADHPAALLTLRITPAAKK